MVTLAAIMGNVSEPPEPLHPPLDENKLKF
jgi:hypothetical protein